MPGRKYGKIRDLPRDTVSLARMLDRLGIGLTEVDLFLTLPTEAHEFVACYLQLFPLGGALLLKYWKRAVSYCANGFHDYYILYIYPDTPIDS